MVLHVWASIGRALYELGDMSGAAEAMREALRASDANEQDDELARIRLSAAIVFAEAGNIGDALEQLARAAQTSDAATLGRVLTQRALILCHTGRLVDALVQANLAETELRRSGDRLGRLRLLVNRSLIKLQLGELVAAEIELRQAHRLALQLDQTVTAALVTANLGVVHARAGRTLVALQHFDQAQAQYEAAGRPLRTMAILEMDRGETLLRAGLFGDAVAAARLAVAHSKASGNQVSVGDAMLLLARAHLAEENLDAAERAADSAAQLLHAGGRSGMSLQARALGLEAALGLVSDRTRAARLLARARRLADRLDVLGWAAMGDDLRVARMRCGFRLGLMHLVEDDLRSLRASVRSRQPNTAIRGWFASSMSRWHDGDHLGALRAARAGMRLLERHRDASIGLEHRVGWSAIGADLAAFATQLSVVTRRPSTVFVWAERTRDNAFRADVLAPTGPRRTPALAEVADQLGGRVLVEFVLVDRQIRAVVVGQGRPRLVDLGDAEDVRRISDHLRTVLHRAAMTSGADVEQVRQLAQRLDEQLIGPLALRPSAELVIVPVGALHEVPWASLPSLAANPFSVAASAGVWLDCDRRATGFRADSVALVVGPDVRGESVERAAIVAAHPGAVIVTGARSTASRVRSLLASADVLQLAAHGVFRADQPMRSSIRLHGEDLALAELVEADVASRLVVLSSCEGGAHGVSTGSEVLGLGSLLLSRGAVAVVAPIAVVSDESCGAFVADIHGAWRNGVSISAAMAAVRQDWMRSPTLTRWATASAFLCFGSGALVAGRGPLQT